MTKWTHVWRGRKYLPKRYGEVCRVVTARKGKFIIEFWDGFKVVTVRGTFKRRKDI